MRIDLYPRPSHDTGIGFHYSTGTPRYGREALEFWLPQLKELGASWLVLPSSFPNAIPDQFVAGVVAAEIEPVVWIRQQPIAPLDGTSLRSILRRFASLGVHYVYAYREPNNVEAWAPSEWARPGLVERFMEALTPCLERILEADMYPVFTPLCPGGHYWDTTFLTASMDWIAQRGKQHLFDRLAIGIQNFASNRPLDWGQGGRKRWPAARPYCCPPGCQDHRGFHMFEWYDEVVRAYVGHSLPLIATENGLVIGTRNHRDYPAVDEKMHAHQTVEMAKEMMSGEAPDHVFNNAFWALEAGEGETFEGHAWYRRDGYRLAAVDALKMLPKRSRRQSALRTLSIEQTDRPIASYLLLPSMEPGRSAFSIDEIMPLIVEHRLTFGFRPEEARQAHRVILLGGPDAIPARIEADLRQHGCQVTRVDTSDTRAGTERLLEDALGAEQGREARRSRR